MDGGEEPRRVLHQAGEDELEAGLVELRSDAEGLRVAPQPRLGLPNGDVQHRAKTDACIARASERQETFTHGETHHDLLCSRSSRA